MNKDMPEKLEGTLAFIEGYISKAKRPPTIREIADGLALGTSTIFYRIRLMVKLGLITVEPNVSRGITIITKMEEQDGS